MCVCVRMRVRACVSDDDDGDGGGHTHTHAHMLTYTHTHKVRGEDALKALHQADSALLALARVIPQAWHQATAGRHCPTGRLSSLTCEPADYAADKEHARENIVWQ